MEIDSNSKLGKNGSCRDFFISSSYDSVCDSDQGTIIPLTQFLSATRLY